MRSDKNKTKKNEGGLDFSMNKSSYNITTDILLSGSGDIESSPNLSRKDAGSHLVSTGQK